MKIIKKGKHIRYFKKECQSCKCVFAFKSDEVRKYSSNRNTIFCPCCNFMTIFEKNLTNIDAIGLQEITKEEFDNIIEDK